MIVLIGNSIYKFSDTSPNRKVEFNFFFFFYMLPLFCIPQKQGHHNQCVLEDWLFHLVIVP